LPTKETEDNTYAEIMQKINTWSNKIDNSNEA
jgi:hypothetical protein